MTSAPTDFALAGTATAAGPTRIVFPSERDLLLPVPLRNVTSCALLRLPDDSMRFLRASATPWTADRLAAVERALARFDDGAPPRPELARRIGYEAGIPMLVLGNPVLDRVDGAAWDVRRTAVAVVSRALCHEPGQWDPARASAEARTLEQRYHAELESALAAFLERLDPVARAAATHRGHLDADVYNFLIRPPHRGWRLQFARSFPILARAAASGARGSGGAHIRALVDAGLPLIKGLASRWAVSPGALRCLAGRAVDDVGPQWQDRPHTLVRILDALRAEDRPGDDAAAWARLADAVAIAEEIFRRPVASSPLTLGWLRAAARHGFAHLDDSRRSRRLPADAVPLIDALRTALVDDLAATAAAPSANALGELRIATATVADRELAALPPARLAASAKRFALDYAARRATIDAQARRADGRTFWPLLPRDFVAATGSRRVTPLATRAALRAEGTAQDLCIAAGAELTHMARACASGRAYLLSIRDAATGAPLSTAEIGVVRCMGVGPTTFRVRQHKAHGNARPSAACVAALREALAWAGGREVQEHLEEGRRQAWKFSKASPGALADLDVAATREALQVALGDDLYASLARAAIDVAAARRGLPPTCSTAELRAGAAGIPAR